MELTVREFVSRLAGRRIFGIVVTSIGAIPDKGSLIDEMTIGEIDESDTSLV